MIRSVCIRCAVVRCGVIMAAFGITACLPARAEGFCAFQVDVRTPTGSPIGKVPVSIITGHTQVYAQTVTGPDGVAKLCDAPFETVDVVVGFDICGSVLIRNLSPTWPEPRKLSVTYAEAPCDHFGVSQTCRTLIRVLDEAGKPVQGAHFSGGGQGEDSSDAFGRIFRTTARRQKIEGVISKDGRQPVKLSTTCAGDAELKVTLRAAQ